MGGEKMAKRCRTLPGEHLRVAVCASQAICIEGHFCMANLVMRIGRFNEIKLGEQKIFNCENANFGPLVSLEYEVQNHMLALWSL